MTVTDRMAKGRACSFSRHYVLCVRIAINHVNVHLIHPNGGIRYRQNVKKR